MTLAPSFRTHRWSGILRLLEISVAYGTPKVNEFLTAPCDDRHVSGVVIEPQTTDSIRRAQTNAASNTAAPVDLLPDLDAAQGALDAQLAELRGSDAQRTHSDILAVGGAKLLQLSRVRDQLVSGANGGAIRAAVTSAIADLRAYTSQVSATVTAAQSGSEAAKQTLGKASDAAHRNVTDFVRDFYDRREFDAYLRFSSTEDEDAYRRREAERRAAIEKALAENTPEGNLRANKLAIEQMNDAGVHGADRSPDFIPKLDGLKRSGQNLDTALGNTTDDKGAAARLSSASDAMPDRSAHAAIVSPEVVAALRGAGVVPTDQAALGNGVETRLASRGDGKAAIVT